MRKGSAFKWAVIGGSLAAVLLFSLEMTTGGIEKVYGPIEGSEPAGVGRYAADPQADSRSRAAAEYEQALRELQKKYGIAPSSTGSGEAFDEDAGDGGFGPVTGAGQPGVAPSGGAAGDYGDGNGNERLPGLPDGTRDSGVNRLADKTADMLQAASSSGIRMIVTLFDSMTE
ncbi:hypothetical protein [Paenibacillus beijingensis]|uniref:Uncharacterized protein n=1 Tax=Paenibacillus beijingensis TaxID=1126833 RepID=A0A0D5NMB3_9BACL|nr:hypothetical protein [Paenibacillus beijingensis]AJY76290.1 hypothetical protein VN24_19140 [Paenibacillus beijingensis]